MEPPPKEDVGLGQFSAAGPSTVTAVAAGGMDPTFKSFRVTDLLKNSSMAHHGDVADINKILGELDRNHDGVINAKELVEMLRGMVRARRERRYMIFVIVALFVFALCTIGAVVGLTYAVVDALKDTQVHGATMYVKGSDTEVVRTGSADFSVVNGIFVNRQTANATETTASGQTTASPNAVMRTATYMGAPRAFTSRVDVRALMELKYLYIKGTGSVELALVVLGVARVPMEGSVLGTVVRILTTAGTITLDDTVIMFSEEMANIFAEAGFTVARNRRMLMGYYDILGFFNYIEDMTVFDLPADQPRPTLPSKNYVMKLQVFEPCVLPGNTSYDRCVYTIADKPASDGEDPTYPPQPPSPPPAAPITNEGGDVEETLVVSNLDPLVEGSETLGGAGGRRHRRSRFLQTAPHRRALQDAGPDTFTHDLAGVVLIDGERFMVHNETATSWEGATRNVYSYALVAGYQKVEVVQAGTTTAFAWQEKIVESGLSADDVYYFCSNYTVSSEFFSHITSKDRLSNFSYIGLDSVNGKAARHFRLVVKQATTDQPDPDLPSTATVDYYESINGNLPLAFVFYHPLVGRVHINVLSFTPIDSASSAEASPALFQPPPANICRNSLSVPRLISPFTIRDASVMGAETDPVLTEGQRRRLSEVNAERAAIWRSLDHINGTGEWPQWALDMYGSAHPAHYRRHLAELAAGGEAPLTEWDEYERSRGLITVNPTITQFPPPCVKGPSIHIPLGDCEASFGNSGPALWVEAACSSKPVRPGIVFTGSMEGDGCENKAAGCIAISLAVSSGFLNKLGIDRLEVFKICLAWYSQEQQFALEAVLTIPMVVAKVEVLFDMRISACCVWIDSVSLEGFIGMDFFFFSAWVSVVHITFVENVYLKGSASAAYQPPRHINRYVTLTVGSGFWGDWLSEAWCGKIELSTSGKQPSMRGRPMNGFGLRMESEGGDDTALNGLRIACLDGGWVNVGDGFWGDWFYEWTGKYTRRCDNGGYFVGARMRIEEDQGGDGDDTAANSIKFKCSGGESWTPHKGYWGSWTDWAMCPDDTFVCGARVRIESEGGDDTALNGLKIICCDW